ncbi:RadC family protein [Marinilactibacillus kalidii]|uniref:RadC family protein n=1 Tax=Marinilactibacillus kalidii TaxID=2820274 RepID=UPI001ABDDF47|nr:DNA repair protein RadC [Marinilactibacillus kalidii]
MNKTIQRFVDVPEQSRPRERLCEYGAKALANHELLAILLRTGTKNLNVLQLSMAVLTEVEDLYSLRHITVEELVNIQGIGKTKAIELIAAIELGGRVIRASQIKEGTVTSSAYIGHLLQDELSGLSQEHVVAIYLNTKNEIIKKETVFKGSLNSSVAHPREIFRGAVKYSAARIIIAHNHPSGNPNPSEADLLFTERMAKAGEMMGIEVLDHIIVGENRYISLKEHDLF